MIQLHDVDLKLLKVFDAVVRCGGFSAAQAELNVGQSTISMQIGQLEVRLGVRLCQRGRSGFMLTEQGRAIHQATQRLFGAIENFRIEAHAQKRAVAGTLQLGVIDNTVTDSHSPLRRAVSAFLASGPDIQINLYIGSPSELEQRVLDGRLHVAIGHFPDPVSGLSCTGLYEELHGLYCGRQHALLRRAAASAITREQLKDAQVVSRGYLRRQDLKLLQVEAASSSADNVEAQAILILSGAFIGFLPRHYAQAWVARGELVPLLADQMQLRSRFSTITRRAPPAPLVERFLAVLHGSEPPTGDPP